MDASEIYDAKEVIFPKENGKFIFPVADGRIKFVGGDQELRTSTLIRDHPIRGESHRLGLFQESEFEGDLDDSKSTSGGTPCVLGSHTFVPISCMCQKQTSVSHSSTESEIISLDAGLRFRWYSRS